MSDGKAIMDIFDILKTCLFRLQNVFHLDANAAQSGV